MLGSIIRLMSIAAFIWVGLAVPADAASRNRGMRSDESGFASMHEWRKVGSKTCFVDHTHQGAGTGSSRRQAEAEAIRAWQDFTALEYGGSWASYAIAGAKTMRCDGGGSSWKCDVDALPCRPF